LLGQSRQGDTKQQLHVIREIFLQEVQYDCYYELIREWIAMASTRRLMYRRSLKWTEVMQMWELFRNNGTYDHRTIQMSHDLIAARFRRVVQETDISDDEKVSSWPNFFKAEAMRWLENSDFLRCFMLALSARSSVIGYDAEDAMCEMMRQQYDMGAI
jgi:hypothetical protein